MVKSTTGSNGPGILQHQLDISDTNHPGVANITPVDTRARLFALTVEAKPCALKISANDPVGVVRVYYAPAQRPHLIIIIP